MDIDGYGCHVQYDEHTGVLRARGTNKAAQIALRGQQHAEGELVLPVSDLATVQLRPATRMVNGRLDLHAADGSRYRLH